MRARGSLIALTTATVLTGCGGSSGGGSAANVTTQQSIGGVWQGTYSDLGVSTETIALVSPTGQYFAENVQTSTGCASIVTGNVSVTGGTYSGSVIAASLPAASANNIQTSCLYPDGSSWAKGNISGNVTTGTSLTLTDHLTTSMGLVFDDNGALTFDTLYNESSSLSKLSGNWTETTGDVQSINSDGTFFEQDAATGCVINGAYSIINANYNIYQGSATYANCTGAAAVLNGQTLSGLFTLNDQTSPAGLSGGTSVTLPGGIVLVTIGTATKD